MGTLTVTTGPGGTGEGIPLAAWLADGSSGPNINARDEEPTTLPTSGRGNGLTLTTDGERIFPSDHLSAYWQIHIPLTDCGLATALKEGVSTTVCTVWPDTGDDTVTLDHLGDENGAYAFRLTDIPVVDA